MPVFCTVISSDFLPFAKTLYFSLRQFDRKIDFYALVVDSGEISESVPFQILSISDLSNQDLVSGIVGKYSSSSDAFRWSMKSVLMMHILNVRPTDQVFFVDPDICFFGDFRFLYEELGTSSFLLSPHWKRIEPNPKDDSFVSLFTHGLYNAGFVGATYKGLATLRWWAEMCIFACEDNSQLGLFVDQKYLDLFPFRNSDTRVLLHRGCNVAVWNQEQCRKTRGENGHVIINREFPLVFVHFTYLSYLLEHDPILSDLLDIYDKKIQEYGYSHSLVQRARDYNERQRLNKMSLPERLLRRLRTFRRFSIQVK